MNLENLEGIPCPFCAMQGVRVLLPSSGGCPRCWPVRPRPSLWRRLARVVAEWWRERV